MRAAAAHRGALAIKQLLKPAVEPDFVAADRDAWLGSDAGSQARSITAVIGWVFRLAFSCPFSLTLPWTQRRRHEIRFDGGFQQLLIAKAREWAAAAAFWVGQGKTGGWDGSCMAWR